MAAAFPDRFRVPLLAVAVSATAHAAVLLGVMPSIERPAPAAESAFVARLVAAPPPAATPAAVPAPRPKPKRRAPLAVPAASFEPMAEMPAEAGPEWTGDAAAEDLGSRLMAESEPPREVAPPPEVVALAEQAAPAEPAADAFPVEALPASVSIQYQLTSAIADGRAEYRWDRDGDSYRIQGEAEAEGFFTLFLEGRILQESRGTVTAQGLRPDRFSEQRPDTAAEGLDFDWPGRRITFDRNGERKTAALEDNTVDWLSMIFQMAHVPPKARDLDLQVFTQRKLYRFRLKVLGVEEIEIPLGKVAALHLRHEDPARKEVVDVWLGIDQHFLPVKLRFPAARNRLVVDQVATRVVVR